MTRICRRLAFGWRQLHTSRRKWSSRKARSMTTATAFDSWIACRKPNPQARLRLFCFPYAGSGASIFRTWSDALPADVEVCPIQFPGRGTRLMETPFTQISPLIEALAQALVPLLDKPLDRT